MNDNQDKNNWIPVTAGILNILSGVIKILAFIGVLIAAIFIPVSQYYSYSDVPSCPWAYAGGGGFLIGLAVVLLVLGILSIIGGVNCIQRRAWPMALIGSIAALIGNTLFGIAAIVLVAIGKDQFDRRDSVDVSQTPENTGS